MEQARTLLRTIRDRMVVNSYLRSSLLELSLSAAPDLAEKAQALINAGEEYGSRNIADIDALLSLLSRSDD